MCYEQGTLEPPNHVIFDFIWEDLIRYDNKIVPVFEDVKIFKKRDERDSDGLFKVGILDVPSCAVYTGAEAFRRYHIERLSEQALAIVHEGPWMEGFRYLQRLDH